MVSTLRIYAWIRDRNRVRLFTASLFCFSTHTQTKKREKVGKQSEREAQGGEGGVGERKNRGL